jgi:hypothetical protein
VVLVRFTVIGATTQEDGEGHIALEYVKVPGNYTAFLMDLYQDLTK